MSTRRVVLAIDGGNVKTDVALVGGDGCLLSLVRGGTSSPHVLGFDGCVEVLSGLVARARLGAASSSAPDAASSSAPDDGSEEVHHGYMLDEGRPGGVEVARVLLSGADLPEEVKRLQDALGRLGWSRGLLVENDTLALLRTGTDRGWGVAVVCGGGINAIGVATDGRDVRFPSLGAISGDWGGGHDAGIAALAAASRSADGRGPRSTLEQAVPEHFGLSTPFEVSRAVHYGEISLETLAELTPVLYAQAALDPASHGILERIATEVVVMATTCLRRLWLTDAGADVVIGGGLIRAAPAWMLERIEQGVHAVSLSARVVIAREGPIVGAAILGLDEIGAGPQAIARARAQLQHAIADLSRQPVG